VNDLSSELTSWSATAAAVADLDVIISVDTSRAHLADALCRPLWILTPASPDWRWMLWRTDTPGTTALGSSGNRAPETGGACFMPSLQSCET
jgi:ADP-heptose:LPS heptosyltransferase